MNEAYVVGKNAPKIGKTPSIFLVNPKFAHNVGMVMRLCSCFGVSQLWFTGNRVTMDIEARGRLPREERMIGYKDVTLINSDYPFDRFEGATPVAVELRDNSENLPDFEHPENAVYVFGPEDGSIPRKTLQLCHRFVVIPSKYCLNLATASAVILYDRAMKRKEFCVPQQEDKFHVNGIPLYERK